MLFAGDNPLVVREGRGVRIYRYTISDPGADTITAVQTSCGAAGVKVADSERGRLRCVFAVGPAESRVTARATDSDGQTGDEALQTVFVEDPHVAGRSAARSG